MLFLGFIDFRSFLSSFAPDNFWFLLWFLQWPVGCLIAYCLTSKCLLAFKLLLSAVFFLKLTLVSLCCGQKRSLISFQSSYIYWALFCGLECNLSWSMLYVPCAVEKCVFYCSQFDLYIYIYITYVYKCVCV